MYFNLNGFRYTLTDASASIEVGGPSGTAQQIITEGTVEATRVVVDNGTLSVSYGGALNVGGELEVGLNAPATLRIRDGGRIDSAASVIGRDGVVEVNGATIVDNQVRQSQWQLSEVCLWEQEATQI